jgi:hypothetical protein
LSTQSGYANNAVVIDNERGWVHYVDASTSHFVDRTPVYRMRPRSPDFPWRVLDCSVGGVRCVEIARSHTVLAFKAGNPGETYSIAGVSFEIASVGTLPYSPSGARKVYWVKFSAPAPRQSGDFVYIDPVGVVRYSSVVLIDGPGLLSAGGFPLAKRHDEN